MFKKILISFTQLDNIAVKIMKHGLFFCFVICVISIFVLCTYAFSLSTPYIYYIGIYLFRVSLIFGIEFIVCGFVVDGIKKELL